MRSGAVAGLGVVLLLPALALAQMYRWEDPRGTLYYTNTPETIPDPSRSPTDALPAAPVLPTKVEPVAPTAVVRSVAITRIPYTTGDPIFVMATISGTGPLTLILDTGADRTMVAPQALWRLGISTANAPRAEIRGVTGASQGDVVRVTSLEIGEAKVGPLRIIAHDADLKKADGLLGRDFLDHFTVTINSRELVVTLVPK